MTQKTAIHPHIKQLFSSLDSDAKGNIEKNKIVECLYGAGFSKQDVRLQNTFSELKKIPKDSKIDLNKFSEIVAINATLLDKAITSELIIPAFPDFHQEIIKIYNKIKKNTDGNVADYIPQLKRVPANKLAVSICTIDGQRLDLGDSEDKFCVQSTCKPINYCLSLKEHGEEYVHNFIGREPSGRGFNELTLNKDGKPHNPMINSGAIMACSLIQQSMNVADRFDYVVDTWQALSGGIRPSFNNAVYLSEQKTADRNFALGHFMREKNAFPENTNLQDTLEFYFQCCSIELNSSAMAQVAATLANGGICPTTEERVFDNNTAKNCLSLLYSCGMYDFSGEFAFTVGLPAKSGVSGALMIVIPNVMGICVWSPRLDSCGNSVRGIDFCKRLVEKFNFHNYDKMIQDGKKQDPTMPPHKAQRDKITALVWAASTGDLQDIKHLLAQGVDLNSKEYDGRTALHLAAANGHTNVVKYLLRKGVELSPKDRWGKTPLSEAKAAKHQEVVKLLSEGK